MVLQYELKLFEDLIKILHPRNLDDYDAFLKLIKEWKQRLTPERERIETQLVDKVLNSPTERHREIYIQHHQKQLIRLADIVYEYLSPIDIKGIFADNGNDPVVNIYQETFQCLVQLLRFIEHNFKGYFNQDEFVPEVYQRMKQEELKKKLKVLEQRFLKQKTDKELVRIILSPTKAYVHQTKITYRQQIYFDEMLNELTSPPTPLHKVERGKDHDDGIIETLVYLNYNTGDFVSYRLKKIVNSINLIPEQEKKIAKLSEYLKELNQVQAKQNAVLKPSALSAKEQITKWIIEEIHYLETKNRLLSIAPVIKDDKMLSEDEKLHFSVSVHVLGILTRAAHESKLILNRDGTKVFENVSKYCRTKQASNPSAGSMDRKSHEAERSHKEKAINVLQEMIRRIYEY